MRWPAILPPATLLAAFLASVVPSPVSADFTLVRTYDGTTSGGEFGYACEVIGDMDGDGIAEFAIGDPADDTGGENAGRVFIYRGGHPLPDDPTWVITGGPGERLGHSLAVGYVDGDPWPDLIIGAPGSAGAPATLTGRIIVAYGGNPLGARPLASVSGTTPDGRFGWAVEGGFRYSSTPLEILVGAPESNGGAGEVHGLAGGDPPPAARLFVIGGVAPDEKFGYALSDAGTTLGYGIGAEFLVGAPGAAGNGFNSGRLAKYVYDLNDSLHSSSVGGAAGSRLGYSVSGGFDINPNFFEPSDDFVVGAPGADPHGLSGAGSVMIDADQSPFSYDGSAAQAGLGSSVRLLEDIAGNALDDLVVGETGAVHVYTGPLYPDASPVATLLAESSGDGFGHAISTSGRIDPGPGPRRRFLIGAPDYSGRGRVYVYTDTSVVTDVEPSGNPSALRLAAPSPNPSRSAFSLAAELPRASRARLAVFDLVGRVIATLHDGSLGPGRFTFEWTPDAARAAGIYWGVLEADGARIARRMIRVR